ncbi:MAG TPA: hypothetical protein VI113_10005 [Alphaproteobacteria bacterium]
MLVLARKLPFARIGILAPTFVAQASIRPVLAFVAAFRRTRGRAFELDRLNAFMLRDVGLDTAHIDRPDRLIAEARERLRGFW